MCCINKKNFLILVPNPYGFCDESVYACYLPRALLNPLRILYTTVII